MFPFRWSSMPAVRGALTPWLVVLWMLGLFFWVHIWFMTPPVVLHPGDEAYIAAFADRLLRGRMLPFVDAVSHRGPLLYWTVALAAKLLGPMSWWPVRVVSLSAAVASVTFTFAAARRARHQLAGALAVVLLAAVHLVTTDVLVGISLNGEPLVNAYVMPGFFCLVVGLGRHSAAPRVGWVFAAGVFLALGGLTKQLTFVLIVPWGLWVVAAALARRRRRRALVAAYLFGLALPIALTVLCYGFAGELRALWYWSVTYNREIYLGPIPTSDRPALLRDWAATYLVLIGIGLPAGLALLLSAVRRAQVIRDVPAVYDRSGFGVTVALSGLSVAAVSNFALRDFPHYYLPLIPWAGLFAGLVIERLSGRRGSPLPQAFLLLPVAALVTLTTAGRLESYRIARGTLRHWPNPSVPGVCAVLDRHAPRGTPLFTWGFAPLYYVGCQRPPASRFLFTTFPSGLVPWFVAATPAEDDARTVPGSRQQLIDDLRTNKRTIILDAPQSLGNRSIACYQEFYAELTADYCDAGPLGLDRVYVRKTSATECPSNSAPVPATPVCVGHQRGPR
jgi:4-amino-4-deoxy-L-arabinose transferase-like glycosyltransferase